MSSRQPRNLRSLAPGLAAMLILAASIAAATAAFTALEQLVLNPLSYPASRELVTVLLERPQTKEQMMLNPPASTVDVWKEHSSSLAAIGVHRTRQMVFSGPAGSQEWRALRTTPDLFATLRTTPVRGRLWSNEEAETNVALLSERRAAQLLDEAWPERERHVELDGERFRVIGVLPRSLVVPHGWAPDVVLPLRVRDSRESLSVIARLAEGASIEQSELELSALTPAWPDRTGEQPNVRLLSVVQQELRKFLWLLSGGVFLFLLIATANVASLLLARFASRQRELAVRTALGATRRQIALQLTKECTAIGCGAGLLGIAGAAAVIRLSARLGADGAGGLSQLSEMALSPALVGLALAITLPGVFLTMVLPAWHGSRPSALGLLRSRSQVRGRARSALLVFQISLVLALTVLGALLLGRLRILLETDVGYQLSPVAVAYTLPSWRFENEASRADFGHRLLERARLLPEVTAATLARRVPPDFLMMGGNLEAESSARMPLEQNTHINGVTPDYFRILGIPVLQGRAWTDAEPTGVCAVNASFAKRLYGLEGTVGRRIKLGKRWMTVAAVVGDVRPMGPTSDFDGQQLYLPLRTAQAQTVVLETNASFRVIRQVRDEIQALSPDVLVSMASTLGGAISTSLADRKLAVAILIAFAATGLLLVTVGLVALILQTLVERYREIGIRQALGAAPSSVVRYIGLLGMRPVVFGVLLGVPLAIGLVQLASHYGLVGDGLAAASANTVFSEPYALLQATLVVLGAGLLSVAVPSLRALRVAPATVLRDDA